MRRSVERDKAKADGLKFYFTGAPCVRGHVAARRVINWSCVVCARENEARNPRPKKPRKPREKRLRLPILGEVRNHSAEPDFYVYLLFRPDGRPCYVGKGRGRRINRDDRRRQNPHLFNIMKAAGEPLKRIKLRENMNEKEALDFEREMIAFYGREEHGGPLVNLTDGGEGASGYLYTAEDRARMSAGLKGKPKSEAHRLAVIQSHKDNPNVIAGRLKSAAARRGKKRSQETIEKMRRATLGVKKGPYSPEHCTAITVGKKAEWALRRSFNEMLGAS